VHGDSHPPLPSYNESEGDAAMIQNVTPFPFQEEAKDLVVSRGNGLIALTMGLGKTLVAIMTIEELFDAGELAHALIVVPASLKFQWQREIKRFTGQNALVIDGSPKNRAVLYRYATRFRYVIINYDLVVKDWAPKKKAADNTFSVRDMDFDAIVLDESTMIKTPTIKRTKYIKFLGKRAAFRIALTGTPVLNRPEELFSQMEFVDPDVLGDPRTFEQTFIVRDAYGRPKRYRNLHVLRKRMAGVMYRKTRADVADQLPAILSSVVPFDLSRPEVQIYNKAAAHTLAKLLEAQSVLGGSFNVLAHYGHSDDPRVEQARGDVMAGMLMLRFICSDPHLIGISSDKFRRGHGQGSALAEEFFMSGVLNGVPKVSTKRLLFMELLQAALDEDPRAKVVAFSTFKDLLDMVQDDTAGIAKSVQFTGDMNARQKNAAMQQFKTDPKTRLFLSSDAGGYGVDLPEANTLISIDLPWSGGSIDQRESRIIRLSSEWEHVNLIVLAARGSIEERMHAMIEEKRGVAEAFLDGGHDSRGTYTLALSSLTEFLATSKVG
jgi:SNF2 family DNA or RNA helicase